MTKRMIGIAALLIVGLVSFVVVGQSLAQPAILDQSHELTRYESAAGVGYSIYQRAAQTLVADVTSQLTQLDFWAHRSSAEQGDLILSILAVDANSGVPIESSILGQTTIPKEQVPIYNGPQVPADVTALQVSVDLRPLNLLFQAGDKFAIGFANTEPNESPSPGQGIAILGDHSLGAGPYPAGQAFLRDDNQNSGMLFPWTTASDSIDLGFRTYMATPEPSTLPLVAHLLPSCAFRVGRRSA